ncbi:hypothetical protein [Frigoriglobus tundricola]|uniref:Uncharacterized protein n=1 Tax=Frigoriglobus tundricola TaxID=2774151 RepID=A0A6M5YZ44_9BACT|nr:hypothetical protein [Frigoriglobus tundricola]QJW98182.1 hypothetical protein FTUN_5762 [Frigoriglobus tundricola]
MHDFADSSTHTNPPPPVTRADLIALGAEGARVHQLPVRHVGPDGEPYWPADEALDLLTLLDRKGGAQ